VSGRLSWLNSWWLVMNEEERKSWEEELAMSYILYGVAVLRDAV